MCMGGSLYAICNATYGLIRYRKDYLLRGSIDIVNKQSKGFLVKTFYSTGNSRKKDNGQLPKEIRQIKFDTWINKENQNIKNEIMSPVSDHDNTFDDDNNYRDIIVGSHDKTRILYMNGPSFEILDGCPDNVVPIAYNIPRKEAPKVVLTKGALGSVNIAKSNVPE